MSLEIERKFALSTFPADEIRNGNLKKFSTNLIEQTYLAYQPTQQIRVRKMVNIQNGSATYTHTFKEGSGIVRNEIEYEISKELYEQLITKINKQALIKTRSVCQLSGMDSYIEIDQYEQVPLIVAEVEFQDMEEQKQFTPPQWFGTEVSSNKRFSNYQLWLYIQHLK
ncbi:CYTH domain-containing protein [Gracilibacillus alcaliphilus]|uniref:CYTH domain-containing protein n=1 Tax=Gracilibacillus alcaliphilus TaxID=1401441 RepID=UPI0019593573|nr:CYTH domain-containing protein [Gracilibacillus alcaliphilus]MBM7679223.1 CYTH domain-containing protein [Gracilibacillus alcaliphilus]